MAQSGDTLRLRIAPELMAALNKSANAQMLTTSAYVRLILAQHVGLIERPSVLVDLSTEYNTKEAHDA